MADDVRRDRAKALNDALGLGYNSRFPLHVLFRMALFVNGEEIIYAGARMTPDQNQHRSPVSGEAVAFTATRVVHATFTGTEAHDEPERGEKTTSCRAWSRRTLTACAAAADSDDWAWHHQWPCTVPKDEQIALTYRDGTTLQLPLDPGDRRGGQLDGLISSVLGDLVDRP